MSVSDRFDAWKLGAADLLVACLARVRGARMATLHDSKLLTRYRFNVDEFQLMGEAGIFGERDRVELFDGEVVAMNPIGEQHAKCVNRLNEHLFLALGQTVIVSIQNPVVLSRHDEPQPDVMILRRGAAQHPGHPVPGDVLLLIEVADSTLAYDRDVKLSRYAAAGIPETWIVDLNGRMITRYCEPTDQGYRVATVFRSGEDVTSTTQPALSIAVNEIIG